MSWDEFRTRIRQAVGKRMDATFYRAHPPVIKHTTPGNFFFAPADLNERLGLLRHHLPDEAAAIVARADQILRHRFHLLGFENVEYGETIDWHLDVVHQKRTPLIPWYKIDFLDFSIAGDHKITWELNRHQHLVTLAKAALLTDESKYVGEAIAQWNSWQQANPYPLGINWASSLEVGFRSLSWLWMRHLLQGQLSPAFENELLRALALNARHIERNLSTYFSPNTHLLGEALALFFIGLLSPQLRDAERWKHLGWKILQQEIHRQVRPDGVYFEQSLYYHVYALDMFLHARVLASINGIPIPADFDDVLRKMLAAVALLAQAGPPHSFGDDDGGRLFNPLRNRADHMTDPLALGSALFHDFNYQPVALTEEALWIFGASAIPANSQDSAASACALPQSGIYVISTADSAREQMILDAGPQGTGRSGHGHADALSLTLSFNGRRWLIDPGTFVYISPGDERQQFRGTRAHNTLTVDGHDQSQASGPFAWSRLPNTQLESWITGGTFTLFAGSHDGYQPLRHRRHVFHLRDGVWLVRDLVEGAGSHLLETSWHFAPDLAVAADSKHFVAYHSAAPDRLRLVPVDDNGWECALFTEPVSPAYGVTVPAPVLRCRARVTTPAEHAMLLASSVSSHPVGQFIRTAIPGLQANSPTACYRYDSSPASHFFVFGPSNKSRWTFGHWASDAAFFYFCVTDQRITHLVCCEASHLHLLEQPVFSRDTPLQYLEWTNRNGESRAHSSEQSVANSISESALAATISI